MLMLMIMIMIIIILIKIKITIMSLRKWTEDMEPSDNISIFWNLLIISRSFTPQVDVNRL